MNPRIKTLAEIAEKKSRIILGLMSGTSLDGLDMALCEVNGYGGHTKLNLLEHAIIDYDGPFRSLLQQCCFNKHADMVTLTRFHQEFGIYMANVINQQLRAWRYHEQKPDLIASHGQTVFHLPSDSYHQSTATLQLGDADRIAQHTGIITISDFRQKHIAAGGAGAPLAVYGDFLLFRSEKTDRILLNIGGIANLTYIPASSDFSKVICTDIGPGNALSDAWVQQMGMGKHFDENGELASKGKVNKQLLQQLWQDDFFQIPFPKTTGKEYFHLHYIKSAMQKISIDYIRDDDMLATLCALTCKGIIQSIQSITEDKKTEIIVSGGGVKNTFIMKQLQAQFGDDKVFHSDKLGIESDAKEAVLFALLANECVAGDGLCFTGNINHPSVSMGKISIPY